MNWTLRPASPADLEPLAEIRAAALRPDLERLGRYDEHRVRQRLRDSFTPEHTQIIEVAGSFAGSIAMRPPAPAGGRAASDRSWWLEHFYLSPFHQGRGLGTAVLGTVLAAADAEHSTVRLNVLQGSAARRLYEQHGFVVESEDPVDIFMIRKFLEPVEILR